MRKTVSRVFQLLAALCLAFSFISSIVMAVRDWPCMSGPSTPFTDVVMLAFLASIPLSIIGALLWPRSVALGPV